MTGIVAETVSCPEGEGYALFFHDGAAVNRCVAVASEDGRLSCARVSAPEGAPFDAAAVLVEEGQDARADVPWAFAMADAAPLSFLLDALGVPLVGRDKAEERLAAVVRDLSRTLSLDRRGLDALAAAPVRRLGTLAFYSGEGERAERRRQAAASYPLLADLIASNLSTKVAVDRGRPLADPLAHALGGLAVREVSRAVLKRVAAAPALPAGCALETVSRFMTLVPADWIPGPGPEWEAFCHAAHALLEDLVCPDEEVPSLLRGCGGKWVEWCARVARKAGHEAGPGPALHSALRSAMLHASDMVTSFAESALLPMAAHSSSASSVSVTPELVHASYRAAYAMLASGRSASDLADLQRRFHQERERVLNGPGLAQIREKAAIRAEIEADGWPALTDAVQAPNGLWIVPLTNPRELADEGGADKDANGVEGLSHCVATYEQKARKCECHIASVRRIRGDGRYERVSTVEFHPLQANSDRLSVRQHLARNNVKPPDEAVDAVNWYVAAVAAGVVAPNRLQIKAFLDGEALPYDGAERLCGYDWTNRSLLEAAVGPWVPFAIPAFRKTDLDGLMASPPVASVADLVPPEILLAPGR